MVSSVVFESPVGSLLLGASERGLCSVEFPPASLSRSGSPPVAGSTEAGVLAGARSGLEGLFLSGRVGVDVPLDLSGVSPFRFRVLTALRSVPRGEVVSYSQLAVLAGAPSAVRAVASVCASNPLPLFIPCHRVVRSDGSLGEFLAGPEVKRFLLELDGVRFPFDVR